MLYAKSTLIRYRYEISHWRRSVIKLYLSISAGYIFFKKNVSSETSHNEIIENVKLISDHVPKHNKPLTDNDFGHYLAGLIDGDGYFSKIGQLVIVFSLPDAFLAYFIKSQLGFGKVRKVKDKNAYLFIISSKNGMIKVLNIINGKLRTAKRLNQIKQMFIYKPELHIVNYTTNEDKDLCNYWLAGFSDADASFQVKWIERYTRKYPEVRINFQIDQKDNYLLLLIKGFLGGNIGYRNTQDTYYYGSTSFGSARNVIKYFDRYHLQSSKHISYLRWRKVYILIQNKEHLTEKGRLKISRLKDIMNKHSSTL